MNTYAKALLQGQNLIAWCLRTARDRMQPHGEPVHVLFCMVDHYEPGTGRVTVSEERARIALLLRAYPRVADAHRDHDGRRPTRTWFFPPHYHRYGNLADVVDLCSRGYGEVELHLHHGKIAPDTAANLRETIDRTVLEYSQFGIFGTENGRKRYGFTHGDWALANSRGNRYCGVNDEIRVLQETGCYADFTFPSMNEANPRKVNAIYYAANDPARPKSHNTGRDVERRGRGSGLMLVEGPAHPYFRGGGPAGLRVVGDAVDDSLGITSRRIDLWVQTGIHVRGQRNWVFVKVHTHGTTNASTVLGPPMDAAFTYMERHYNDGARHVLHYVTARELYNIVKAAEAGEPDTDPNAYRDYRVSPPRYEKRADLPAASDQLRALLEKTYRD